MTLREKLDAPLWKAHVIGQSYSMKNRDLTTEICKIVYYPLEHDDPTALIEIPRSGFNDYREVPIRFLSPFYPAGKVHKKGIGNYIVHSDGTIWSKKMSRFISTNKLKDKRRKYIGVWMNGKHIRLHRVIASAFLENPNNYPEVNHINGDPADNRVENLEWCNPSMNQIHARVTGLRKGRFTANDVYVIKQCLSNGFTVTDIAKYYKTHTSNISRIKTGKRWGTI